MKITLALMLCLLMVNAAHARKIQEEKRVLIDQVLELTGAQQITKLLSQTLTKEIIGKMHEKYGQVDRAVVAIVFAEAERIMYEDFILNNKLNDILYDLYDESFSLKQMQEITEFYSSPTGIKMIAAMPSISQRSMEAARQHAGTLSEKIYQRINERLESAREAIERAEAEEEAAPETKTGEK